MTRPSDFSPTEALQVVETAEARRSLRETWGLRIAGLVILIAGWLAVSMNDLGTPLFAVDVIVFLAMGVYAFAAATASRRIAVGRERKLRLGLLVHNMELENMAMRDELTQLFNRRFLLQRLDQEMETAQGFKRPLGFIAIDLKSLDHVNHSFGYDRGDEMLAAFGGVLLTYTRATDLPARMSGNKFGVILPDTTKRGCYAMVERLIQATAETALLKDVPDFPLEVAFGVAGYPWNGQDRDTIVRQAETDLEGGAVTFAAAGSPGSSDIPAAFRNIENALRDPEVQQQ
ncbi:MAG: GGDEF domain-containing protein [Dehalococcoidia bacterium]